MKLFVYHWKGLDYVVLHVRPDLSRCVGRDNAYNPLASKTPLNNRWLLCPWIDCLTSNWMLSDASGGLQAMLYLVLYPQTQQEAITATNYLLMDRLWKRRCLIRCCFSFNLTSESWCVAHPTCINCGSLHCFATKKQVKHLDQCSNFWSHSAVPL